MSFRIGESHHLYYGIALILASFLWGGVWLWLPGALLVLDDLLQHFCGVDPSPIHRLYVRYLWPIPFVQRLNRWLDHVL